jgi:hypothetical protein
LLHQKHAIADHQQQQQMIQALASLRLSQLEVVNMQLLLLQELPVLFRLDTVTCIAAVSVSLLCLLNSKHL